MNRAILGFLVLTSAFALVTPGAESAVTPAEAFERLKALVGEWEGTTEKGRVIQVSYRLAASKTVLTETWTLGPQRDSLTLYHMDNGGLIATHYCPIGNQPRLRFSGAKTTSHFVFEFVSATNLLTPGMAHQHQFEIEVLGADSFARSETYLADGVAGTERIVYARTRR